jgi:hypothetical protein
MILKRAFFTQPSMEFVEDPDPDRVKTLIFATPPIEYVAETAEMWARLGFAGFIRSDVMKGWDDDVWANEVDVSAADGTKLRRLRAMNEKLDRAGVGENVISVPFSKHLPDWFDDEGWATVIDNFRKGAKFARKTGFVGLALDMEYIEEIWGLHWGAYLEPGYPREKLRDQARLRGYQVQEAMLSEFPGMVTFQLPETYSIMGELSKDIFLGSLEALADAGAPGGMHICPECTYFQTSPDLMIARYGYGLDRLLHDELEPKLASYWAQCCSVALGLAPLGYLRPIRDESGKRIGFGGREEIFGNRLIKPGEDKGGNYPTEVFREVYAAARMTCRRYVWIYSHGPSWWRMTPEQYEAYGGHETAMAPLAEDFEKYAKVIRKPEFIDRPDFAMMHRAMSEHESVDVLAGLGMPPSWWVVGPFPNPEGRGYERVHPPERSVDLAGEYEGAAGMVTWHLEPVPPMGYVDLSRLVAGGVEIQGYAASWLVAEKDIEAEIRFGSDDTAKIWLDGKLIHECNSERRAMPDEDVVPITLGRGRHQMLLKIGNYRGGWGFYFRITDGAGSEVPSIRWIDGSSAEHKQMGCDVRKKT